MTLVLGLRCKEGLLLISDGQTTLSPTGQAHHAIRTPSRKVHAYWTNVSWGAAGSTNLISEIESNLRAEFPPDHFVGKIRNDITKEIFQKVATWNAQIYQRSGSFYAANILQSLGTNHMFVGHAQDGPFILVVYMDHIFRDFIDTGYAAIGSGEIFPHFALAGLKHFKVDQRMLLEAKLIAYRIVDDAIRLAAFGLGEPIGMVEIPDPPHGKPATARELTADEIVMLGDKVAEWKAAERETLEKFVGVSTASHPANDS